MEKSVSIGSGHLHTSVVLSQIYFIAIAAKAMPKANPFGLPIKGWWKIYCCGLKTIIEGGIELWSNHTNTISKPHFWKVNGFNLK